jgi:hypothetical protein
MFGGKIYGMIAKNGITSFYCLCDSVKHRARSADFALL